MHERGFTEEIVRAIVAELGKVPGGKPLSARVKIGDMLHLDPDSVRMHYEEITRGTRLEGARLDLEEIPARVYCRTCNHAGALEDHHLLFCPSCDSPDVELLNGNEITVEQIEIGA